MTRLFIVLAAAAAVVGCAGGPVTSQSEFGSAPVAVSLSEDAAGPITAATPYSAQSLSGLFPGFKFDTVRTMDDGRVVNFLAGFDEDGFQAFQVEGNASRRAITAVHVVGPAGAGPRGERVGMTYADVGGRGMSCDAGRGQWTGMAICKRSGSKISYIFSPEEFSGSSGTLPRGDELANARIVRMIWEA
ncbi:MAG: DUF1131 family protein [Pseudomonadota bacterium]